MFYERELFFLKKIMEKQKIKLKILKKDDLISDIVFDDYKEVFKETLNKQFNEIFPEISIRALYRLKDILSCHFIILTLPNTDDTILIIGPYLLDEITHEEIYNKGSLLNLSENQIKKLEYFYSTITVIKDENQFFAATNAFCEFIWGGADSYTVVDINKERSSNLFSIVHENIKEDEQIKDNIKIMELRYQYETELLSAVSKGQIHKAEEIAASFSTVSFENRVSDNIRNTKNYCIIMNTLLRKAAQDGGVHPINLDKISSNFAKKIEQLNNEASLRGFMAEMLNTYCRLVRKHSIKNYSPLIQNTIIKIDSDLTSDLSLNTIAQIFNVNASYLSTLFKSETGVTLTEYVNKKRINYAKHLLKSTNLQIQTVAQNCGILDVNYFSKLFKKYEGITAKEYRKNLTIA